MALVAWPVLVAISRLYLGMHFISDTVAGAIIGALSALIGWRVVRRDA